MILHLIISLLFIIYLKSNGFSLYCIYLGRFQEEYVVRTIKNAYLNSQRRPYIPTLLTRDRKPLSNYFYPLIISLVKSKFKGDYQNYIFHSQSPLLSQDFQMCLTNSISKAGGILLVRK